MTFKQLTETLVTFGAREKYVYPYPHCLWSRCDQVEVLDGRLEAEGQLRTRTSYCPQVVDEHVLDGREQNASSDLLRRLVRIIDDAAPRSVEDEPAPVPQPKLRSHLDEVTAACGWSQVDVWVAVDAVTRRLDELAQVKVTGTTNRKIAGHWT